METLFAVDGGMLVTIVLALALFTACLLYVFSRKPKALKIGPVNLRKIMEEMNAEHPETAAPRAITKVSWVDGPPSRSRRRYGFQMKQKGLRTWILPAGAMSRKEVVRRKSANVVVLAEHYQTANN